MLFNQLLGGASRRGLPLPRLDVQILAFGETTQGEHWRSRLGSKAFDVFENRISKRSSVRPAHLGASTQHARPWALEARFAPLEAPHPNTLARIESGSDDNGKIDEQALRDWVKQSQSRCAQYGRAEIGDQKIGEALSTTRVVGKDGVWPCEEVRKVLEECGTPELATGFQVGVYNSRGVHARGDGGDQERDLAATYRRWARQLAFEYPFVTSVVKGIAEKYDKEAEMWDSESAVRRRLGR